MISYSCTVNSVSKVIQIGASIVLDGTEQFDSGEIVIKHDTRATAYTEADDVVITIGGVDYSFIIQADKVERLTSTLYDHTITLTEETAKLVKEYPTDKFFTVNKSNGLWTHQEQLDRMRLTSPPGKSALFTIASATQTALGIVSPQKKYEGLNWFNITTDVMRGIKAVSRLSNGVLGHTLYNALNNPITLSNLTGWQKDHDFNNYATSIISNAKNMTYDADLSTGATWFPSKSEGIGARASQGKYTDDKAEYQMPMPILRTVTVMLLGVEETGGAFLDLDISDYVVSKEQWDGLILGDSSQVTLHEQFAQRNTLYYSVGDNVIKNMATTFKDGAITRDTMEMVVKSALDNEIGYVYTDYKSLPIRDYKIQVFYQPYINAMVSSEKWDDSVTKRSGILNNQKDSTLDLGRYGNVLNDIANRLTNGVWIIKQRHSLQTELLELNDYTSDGYKIIKARHELYPDFIDSTYELAKNWVTIDGYQTVYRSTDPYTIGRDNVDANVLYKEYLEFSTTNRTNTGSLTADGYNTMMNMFDYTSGHDTPIYAMQCSSTEFTDIVNNTAVGIGARAIRIMSKFNNTINAGNAMETTGDDTNEAVQYTDDAGFLDTVTLRYVNDITTWYVENDFPRTSTFEGTYLVEILSLLLYKNPNEVLGINYELHPSTDSSDDIIVTDAFSVFNNLANDGSPGTLQVRVSAPTTKYTIFDTESKEVVASTTLTSAMINKTTGAIDVSSVANTDTNTWCISSIGSTPVKMILAVNYDGTDRSTIYINNLLERSTTEQL